MPPKFTADRAKVLAILADDEGHANHDLCKRLGKNDPGNMSSFLKEMQKEGLILKGPSRPTSNPISKRPGSPEQPFYIDKNDDFYSSFVDYVVKEDLKDDLAIFLRSYVFSWPASRLAFGDYSILSVPMLPVSS